jgi:hypothetical protein
MAKAQIASLITRIENSVDELRSYLEKRGENASDAKSERPGVGPSQGPALPLGKTSVAVEARATAAGRPEAADV